MGRTVEERVASLETSYDAMCEFRELNGATTTREFSHVWTQLKELKQELQDFKNEIRSDLKQALALQNKLIGGLAFAAILAPILVRLFWGE